MRIRRGAVVFVGASASALLALTGACTTDYQQGLDDPNYARPNGLAGQKQPGSTSDIVQGTPEGGAASSSSGGSAPPVCVAAGGTLLADGGTCNVSFKTDVLGAFGNAVPACSTVGCHGGVTPPNPPRIDQGDPAGMYTEFETFKISNGAAYINPCSTDPTASGIECNVAQTGGCGSHMPQGGQLDPADIAKIDAWLKCGSPNN